MLAHPGCSLRCGANVSSHMECFCWRVSVSAAVQPQHFTWSTRPLQNQEEELSVRGNERNGTESIKLECSFKRMLSVKGQKRYDNFALIYSPLRSPRGQLCHEKGFHLCITFFSILSVFSLLLHSFSWKQTYRRSVHVSFPVAMSVCQTRPSMLPCYFQSRDVSRSLFLSVRTKKCVKVQFEF